MTISPVTSSLAPVLGLRPGQPDSAPQVRTPPTSAPDRPPPRLLAQPKPPEFPSIPLYLGDYLRTLAENGPLAGRDEDYARVYDGDRLVGRIHNSGAATLFGVAAPPEWASDKSARQGPAEAQRRSDQFAARGYRIESAATATTGDKWRPPPPFDQAAYEVYAEKRADAAARTSLNA
jgi:hypothetical protein